MGIYGSGELGLRRFFGFRTTRLPPSAASRRNYGTILAVFGDLAIGTGPPAVVYAREISRTLTTLTGGPNPRFNRSKFQRSVARAILSVPAIMPGLLWVPMTRAGCPSNY